MPAVEDKGYVLSMRRPDMEPRVSQCDVTAESVVPPIVGQAPDTAIRTLFATKAKMMVRVMETTPCGD